MANALVEFFASALGAAGESKLIEVLQELHDTDTTVNKDQYKSVILGGYSFAVGIKKLTDKTKTKIDDALRLAVQEAVETSAATNGISLHV